jgi:O-antigen/teichoic acid export membrane protein
MSEAADTPQHDGGLVRGGTLLIAAKLVAVIGGFALYWFLARVFTHALGEVQGTAAFGTWGATFGVINPLNAMAAAGTLQMMSRLVAQRGGSGRGSGDALGGDVFGRAARMQLIWMLGLFAGLELSAGALARFVLNDASYAAPLRLAALIPLFYALRALYEGYLNGTQRFRDQALLDIGATLLRLLFVLAGAASGYGALGAIGGFVVASLCMAAVAVLWVRPERGPAGASDLPGAGEILAFQAGVIGVTLASQYLLNVDLLGVKALASPDPATADRLAGAYTAAQKLAQVPLSVVLALGTLMFSYVASDPARSARIVRQGMRVLLLMMVPSAALLAANAHETLQLVFPTLERGLAAAGDAPGVAAHALGLLAVAYVPCAMLLTCTTLITAAGRPGVAAGIAAIALVLAAIGVRALTPAYGPAGAAAGAGAAWLIGLALGVAQMLRRIGPPVDLRSASRIGMAGAVVAVLASLVPAHGPWLVLEDLALVAVYVLLLLGMRELGIDELRGAMRSAYRGRPA